MTTQTNDTKRTPAVTATMDTHENGADRLTLTFGNGKTLELLASDLSTDIARQALMHGLKQKLVDAAAISRNTDTGRPASVDDKYAAVKTVFDRLLAGEWNAAREGQATGGLLLNALTRLYPEKTADALREWLAKKSDAEKTAMRKNPKVAAMIETIRAETGKAASVDTDALLDELNDD
jgi:hypothetical protein